MSKQKNNKITSNSNVYLPNDRTNYSPKDSDIKSTAPNGDVTMLPNPANDPVVANNIATWEFNYTEDMTKNNK